MATISAARGGWDCGRNGSCFEKKHITS